MAQRFKADDLVIATMPFSCEVGGRAYSVAVGDRFNGDHPAVKANPQYFESHASPSTTPGNKIEEA
jgi:hypothetical protein